MGTTVLYLLSITALIVLMTLFSGVVYWFGRPTKNDYQIVSERHDQPDANRRIIACPSELGTDSPETIFARHLADHFDGELLVFNVLTDEMDASQKVEKKEDLQRLADESQFDHVDTGYVLCRAPSVVEGINRVIGEYAGEVVVAGWDGNDVRLSSGQSPLSSSLLGECDSRLILVENSINLPVQTLLVPVFSSDAVPFLLGICAAASDASRTTSCRLLRESRKSGDDLEREQFRQVVESTIKGNNSIEGEWLRKNVETEINFIPAGSFTDEIVDRSKNADAMVLEANSESDDSGEMFSEMIRRAECPLILVRERN